ncbi:hypothetical protein ACC848_39740, partial [Rhizobium johnstonii]
ASTGRCLDHRSEVFFQPLLIGHLCRVEVPIRNATVQRPVQRRLSHQNRDLFMPAGEQSVDVGEQLEKRIIVLGD